MDDEALPGSDAEAVRSRLVAVAGRVRHPSLTLVSFAAELPDISDDEDQPEEVVDDDLPTVEREAARLRRAAVLLAALDIVDRCIDDLQVLGFGEDGQPDDDDEAAESFVYEWFPPRHREAYNEAFFRKVLVTAVKVANDLADPQGGPAACLAEEIILHAAGVDAGDLCDVADLSRPWLDPDEMLLEDTDFEYLYSKDMDGLENDPAMQAALSLDVPPLSDWFTPFNSDRLVHPYAQTVPTASRVHDLQFRLADEAEPSTVLAPEIIDATAPVGSFAAGSEVVALARQTSDTHDVGLWIADDNERERSFAALMAAAAASEEGSGWLEWEPYEGADTIRDEPVLLLTPHRHFPVGDDEPWVRAAVGGGRILAVPLRFVVSYRPDPEVRRRWNKNFEDLLP